MKLTVSVEATGAIFTADISGLLPLDYFKAYLEAETDIGVSAQILVHNGHSLTENTSLESLGVADGDLIVLLQKNRPLAPAAPAAGDDIGHQAEVLRQQLLTNQPLREQLQQADPTLHLHLNDAEKFKDTLAASLRQQNGNAAAERDELRRLEANPDDPANQARILEIIRRQQIAENMQLAYEVTPESFASVTMLYIDMKVNGKKVQAFVDLGAQLTIISPKLAEEVGIAHLIDTNFRGVARGVGQGAIEGKIHSVPISVGDSDIQLPCSFYVMNTDVELLFGLDMLRRHQCVVDLKNDKLVVGGTVETRFLPELAIKNNAFANPLQKSGGAGFGGNIFSPSLAVGGPSAAAPSKKAASSAAAAAVKRQNTGEPLKYREEDIAVLTGLGASRKEAIFALDQAGGNVEVAASLLFQ